MKRKVVLAAAAGISLFGATTANAAVNLVVNGGFENNTFGGTGPDGYYNIGPAGSGANHDIPDGFGWSVPVNNVDIVSNGRYGPNLSTGGAFNLDLVGYGSSGAISQTLATIVGQQYLVSLDYSSNDGINNPTAIIAGDSTIGTITGTHAWQNYTGLFTATSTSTTFMISEGVGGGNAGVFLDNINVSAVPEPATWAMILLGFGLIGFAMRKRSNVRTTVSYV